MKSNEGPARGPRRRLPALALLAALAVSGGAATLVAEPAAVAQRSSTRSQLTDFSLKGSVTARPLVLVVALGALSLLPFAIIMVTSFVKISVVLSIVRSALGTQQMPPTQVITGMALIMTVFIMAPVGLEVYRAAERVVLAQMRPGQNLLSAESVDLLFAAANEGKDPMRGWLMKHSHAKDRAMFYLMGKRLRKPEDRESLADTDFMVIVPAFVVSELKESFQIGFIIFVPFLVIDLVVANILMALGMQMLSPTTISLPFKLLLFVVIDGWYLISQGLITGYL